MSRSYRKNPVLKDGGNRRRGIDKRIANKAVRNTVEIASGGAFHKVVSPYDLCDRWERTTFREHMAWEWDHYYSWTLLFGPQPKPDIAKEWKKWRIEFYWK